MFPEPIPSPDPLDPMEGTCSHGNCESREEHERRDDEDAPVTQLRQLCGDLEDMCVFKDTVNIMQVRERLEPAVAESEEEIARLRALVEARPSAPAADDLQKLRDAMLASWEKSIERKKRFEVSTADRAYWQGCADAEATWITEIRKRIEDAIAQLRVHA